MWSSRLQSPQGARLSLWTKAGLHSHVRSHTTFAAVPLALRAQPLPSFVCGIGMLWLHGIMVVGMWASVRSEALAA